jgi:membrane protease YdiL (CAAX protease family)
MIWPSVVFVCLLATYALESSSLFRYWEPLWPKWVSDFRYLGLRGLEGLMIVLLLLVVVSAGDALDREAKRRRGTTLWTLARLRVDRDVARSSTRGFLVGLLCGGVLTAAVLALQWAASATTSLQPRGFFFYTLNSSAPALTSLLFFLGVALAEELGYRFFAGGWLLALTRRPWVAIVAPAVIYGLTHTRLDFLPPAGPWWGRALALTLVGCVWGWAFLRYDALTVVLSHFTADLFIFNWPRIADGDVSTVVVSAMTIAVPLLPALLWWVLPRRTQPAA